MSTNNVNLKATTNATNLAKLLHVFLPKQMPVMITGAPGIGKSEIVEDVTEKLGYDLIISHPVVSDPTDYKGLPFMNDKGEADFVPFSDLKKIMTATRPTVFFFDDLGHAPSSVQAATMQLVLAREINGKRISDHVSFISATNRAKDKAGVSGILEPLKSRFAIYELEANVESWIEWALKKDWIDTALISAVKMFPDWIIDWKPSKHIENSPCPRNLVEVAKMMNMNLPDSLQHTAFAGRMGSAESTRLCAFLQLIKDLPDLNEIEYKPLTATVPNNPSSQYALVGALVNRANTKNIGALTTYMDRVGVEYSTLFMKFIVSRKEELCNTTAFTKWVGQNKEILGL
jgi:hypothetical protein